MGDRHARRGAHPRWRRAGDVAVLLVLLALVLVGAARFVDTTWAPVVVAQTAGPFVVVGLVLLLVGAALLRRWWTLLPVGAALAASLVVAGPTFVAHTSPGAKVNLTVVAQNMRFGGADSDMLMDAVRLRSADVLVVTELTPEAADRLAASGATDWFRYQVGEPVEDSFTGTRVYSRYPLTTVTQGDDPSVEQTPSHQPEVLVDVGGTAVRLKAVHIVAPITRSTPEWRAGLTALADWSQRQSEDTPLVLAGDFNSGFGHPGFRQVASGLLDAEREAGLGWVRTWPYVGQRVPAYVQIDHVLTRGLVLVAAGHTVVHGTDHALVWASYSLP
ncbi:endonuclease/exonuclease/phosphatase family protein [Terracoccus luteus]|uniref:Endonuclease/exonuclease/phosphatase (EEP) superfamily protein YafD n=1 Tax=Terracoccus luteus TaxID=53356 RepID=A0A839PQL8_9MICO|nr:endonuclease/exonuclease/phosphatase family protein [Terracoccus luteus]MBB2985124.1 endonuclease/exonuclease/phosphatase (EEP) superfamily protein YafD [Terracoccus luteus]MCP2170776.1 endonuclease/exonuclease/phosphatase (EEP) superfamily protein YafD [Terracoccus luteus]